jgi:hypothetical protein
LDEKFQLCHHSLVGVKPFAYVFWNHGLFEKHQLKEDHPPFNFNTFLHINYLSSSSLIGLGFEQVWHPLLALIRQLHNCANVIWSLKRSGRSSYFYLDYFSLSKSFDHMKRFWHLIWAYLTTCIFYFILFLIPLYIWHLIWAYLTTCNFYLILFLIPLYIF